ncbi:uncharacterized protein [Heptranchias perlo]|uniref:uncharacterized protein isoform X2 n=1 Tax=Heptranchias perlo TaxID=212740 RepID=UPI00355AC32B
MLSAIVGGGVSRGQQLPTPEAASLLLAQELCIGLRSRRVTRMSVQSRPSQPQAVPPAHRLGERGRQLSTSEAASLLLAQELQSRRVTRMSVQSKPTAPEAAPQIRTHTLKSSGRTVRKLNYRKVANSGLVGSPDVGAKKRNARPKSKESATDGGGEGRLESRAEGEEKASVKLSREVGLVQRKRAGAVGKSHFVVRRSKPCSVMKPGSNQADSEVGPETWSSTITKIELKAELPEVHIWSSGDPAALAASLCSEDDSSCDTAPSVAGYEKAEDPTEMDNCERGDSATDVRQRETKCSYLLCSSVIQSARGDRLFSVLANEMCTENGASGDVSEKNKAIEVAKCEEKFPATTVKHVEVDMAKGLLVQGESTGEALVENELVVVPLPAAATEKLVEIELVKVPLEDVVTSDVPDQMPSDATATSHLLAENEVAVEDAATMGTLAENGLAEVTPDPASMELTTQHEVTSAMLLDVPTTNGVVEGALTEVLSNTTEAMETAAEGEVAAGVPLEDVITSETLAENQLATEVLAREDITIELESSEFLAEHKLTDVSTDTISSEGVTKAVPLGVATTKFTLPENGLHEVPPDPTMELFAESELPSEVPVERVMANVLLGENELADIPTDTLATMEVSSADELATEVPIEDVAADGALTENELAAIEVSTAGELAPEVGVTAGSPLAEKQLAGEALVEAVTTAKSVTFEVLADGELVDIPTDILVTELTAENETDEAKPLEVAKTKEMLAENGLFALSPDTIYKEMSAVNGPAQAVPSKGMTTSRVFSENEFSPGSLAPTEDETVREVPVEGVKISSILEENASVKPPPEKANMELAAEGEVMAAMANNNAEGEVTVARDAIREEHKGIVESKILTNGICSINTFRNKQTESLTSNGGIVCAYSESDAMCCEDNGHRPVESSNSELESVSVQFTNHVHVQFREQEASCVENKRDQMDMDRRTDMLGNFGMIALHEEAAICSTKRKALRSISRRKGFRLKMKKLNHVVLLSNFTPNFPKLEKFWLNRTSASLDCCSRESNCLISDKLHQMEEIKPKILPLLPLNDLACSKLPGEPVLLEHLSTIANGLGVFSKCVEMQQEFSRTSELIIAMGMCSRFQSQKFKDLQFCFNTERLSYWDTFCHLPTPSKEQSISVKPLARFYGKDQHWPLQSNCTQSVHFITPVFPVSPHLNLDSMLSSFADSDETFDQRSVSERRDLSIVPQHLSEDSWMVFHCQAGFGKTFWPPASPFRTGRCPCTRSKFGLHTVLALSSPACYRLWTRQRHFGRVPNAQQPYLTQFGEGLKKLIPPVPSDQSFWSLPYTRGGVVSWWSQYSPSTCVSTFNISPLNNCRRSSLGSSPSYFPSCLVAGNGTDLSEAKSLLLLQTNKKIDLQHLNFACIKEPYLALSDLPTSSAECTVTDGNFASASPIPSITYVETQLHSEQKEERAAPDKPVSKSKGSLRKVSQIRIRKTVPKQDTNLTPMGLPKPKRLKKKEFSLEEIYTNQNYKSPSAHSKYLETIFEEPVLKKGSFICTSLQKRKRLLEFQDYTLPRKRRAHAGVKVQSRTRGRKATTREGEIDSLLVQKLTELEAFLAGED